MALNNTINLIGGNIIANNVNMNIDGNLNIESLQDSYEQNSESISVGLGFGSAGPANLNNVNFGYGATEIFAKTTKEAAGIKELSSYDQNISESENLTALLASNSINVAKNIVNNSDKKDYNYTNADIDLSLSVSTSYFTEAGREDIAESFENFGENILSNPLAPTGMAEIIEGYTGQELTWELGDFARFKEKGNEYDTAVPGANTIGMANVITTNPNDPDYDPDRVYLIGQAITADSEYYNKEMSWANEGGAISLTNNIPGFNSMSVFHDKFTEDTFLGALGLLQLSILPAIPINYYGLIGKNINNFIDNSK